MEDRDKDNKIDEETTVTSEGGEQKPDGAAPKSDGDDDYEKICYVCRRPESKAGTMITMPGGMNFCHDCMQKAFDSVTQSGLDFSKLQNMPYMNMNLSDFPNLENMNLEIPKKNKRKRKKRNSRNSVSGTSLRRT